MKISGKELKLKRGKDEVETVFIGGVEMTPEQAKKLYDEMDDREPAPKWWEPK